jgi:type II secretory pathway component PulM
VVCYWYQFVFRMQMIYWGCLVAPRDQPHSRILGELEFMVVNWLAVWEPYSTGITHDQFNQSSVGEQKGLFVVAPVGATDCTENVRALTRLGSDVQ